MKIAAVHSHFNGLEYLVVRRPTRWQEVQSIISKIDWPISQRVKAKQERTAKPSRTSISDDLSQAFSRLLHQTGWIQPARYGASVRFGGTAAPNSSRNGIDGTPCQYQNEYIKDRVAVEVRLKRNTFVASDPFIRHLAAYVRDQIDVGIEILPMKSLQSEMSSGPGYYEGELYNVIRNGRGVPAVPLVMIGIAP